MPKKVNAIKPSGLFVIDLKSLNLSEAQLRLIDEALQDTVQREIAKIDDTEGLAGGPLEGIAGFVANRV
ncbi:hypothetical protein hmeg3_13085 [Herbaspirillum sp. meg3]|uniref:hypothetical protein n=1 Tax=Herbaspirillum sp. meg3 TaxID=2025949 RepID=UPI000B982984|nr:hypothetical protein [Herbaspirillum sp. meg3]ASU39128.1 hypothetical protein hmeg3_13085 [Herbaspirillum sp. meg3]